MSNKKLSLLTALTLLLLFPSCVTYYIPINSFKEQFAGIDSTKFVPVEVDPGFPGGLLYLIGSRYLANPLTKIKCLDKKGNPTEVEVTPNIEIRFTYGEKNKRRSFFFDRIYVTDSTVTGTSSRLFSKMSQRTIPLQKLKKIEIQNDQKKYYYKNKR